MSLRVEDFAAFVAAVHGFTPFRWQQRLVAEVAETGVWPELVDLPTGAGKTSVLDVALFVQALRGDQPRRVVFVVDRRIVVHQASTHAGRLRDGLERSDSSVVIEVARRLRASTAGGVTVPLEVAELRGGIDRDEDLGASPGRARCRGLHRRPGRLAVAVPRLRRQPRHAPGPCRAAGQ